MERNPSRTKVEVIEDYLAFMKKVQNMTINSDIPVPIDIKELTKKYRVSINALTIMVYLELLINAGRYGKAITYTWNPEAHDPDVQDAETMIEIVKAKVKVSERLAAGFFYATEKMKFGKKMVLTEALEKLGKPKTAKPAKEGGKRKYTKRAPKEEGVKPPKSITTQQVNKEHVGIGFLPNQLNLMRKWDLEAPHKIVLGNFQIEGVNVLTFRADGNSLQISFLNVDTEGQTYLVGKLSIEDSALVFDFDLDELNVLKLSTHQI